MSDKHPIVHELEAQDDLRRELLRFCRFMKEQGYILTTRSFLTHVIGEQTPILFDNFEEDFEGLVEQALETDEIDWFKRALQAGYAQDGGAPPGKNMRQVQHTCGCLLLQAVYGNVTCWYVYRDAERGSSSPLVTTCPCCQNPLGDADMSPVANEEAP